MISFCTEKTIEFSLIHDFSTILGELGNTVAVQFWRTREGNNTSYSLHGHKNVYLTAFFARRPKVDPLRVDLLQCKINNYIFEFNDLAKNFDIPVFCGLPLAHNLFELQTSERMWFHIPYNAPQFYESIFNVSGDEYIPIDDPLDLIRPINKYNVIELLKCRCVPISWLRAVEVMTELNRKPGNGPWFTQGWQNKPVYFIVMLKP